ncbi:MAG: hypothetical protein LBC87_01710 [Fibromonadaceae bacterium]|jgi:hypothetical protein|nr:hypothetical protein [Fibromonadaceae bacterium]
MKKILFIATCLFLLSCSSENEDDEWIQPRACFKLLPPCVPYHDEYTSKECNSSEVIEQATLTLEEHGCLFKKSACLENEIEGRDNEKNIKCERELN